MISYDLNNNDCLLKPSSCIATYSICDSAATQAMIWQAWDVHFYG